MAEVRVDASHEVGLAPKADANSDSLIIELRATRTEPSGRLFELFPLKSGGEGRKSWLRFEWLFLLVVGMPTLLASVYYGFVAADQYVTETKFIVRSAASSDTVGLATLVQSRGLSRAVDESYAVDEYVVSPDVIPLLDKDGTLRQIFARPEADFLSRFPGPFLRGANEQFQKHLKNYITVKMDPASGISTLQVSTFRAEDSLYLATELMALGEAFVNKLNARANADAMAFAEEIQVAAVDKLRDADQQLTDFRNRELVVDPNKEISSSVDRLSKVALEISELEATAAQTTAQTPNGPQIAPQRQRIKALKNEHEQLRSQIVGGDGALSSKLSKYQRLVLKRDLAAKAVSSAALGIEQARHEANARRIYLQNIVNPQRADMPIRPSRLISILSIFGLSLCLYMLARTFGDTVLEHQA